uniref:DUF4220 domain-containing protein n=1 Tax=Leersia perrieri TaxID=77586 RepID=A0A0D9X2L5_9ORYZ
MGSLVALYNEWQIQLIVLLSFILQVLLFFTGSLRQGSTNGLLRGSIWLAYLGADMVAIYALGYLSRHQDNGTLETHPLVFFWAPFLLIHLGGQDTITAFSIEDNKLWLRHLLNMILEVSLALYVVWKSTSLRNNVELLVPALLLFVSGIIKYVERTMALKYGSQNEDRNPAFILDNQQRILRLVRGDVNHELVYNALVLDGRVRHQYFHRRSARHSIGEILSMDPAKHDDCGLVAKLLDAQLSLLYNDIYTKAPLLRSKSGILVRCISQVSTVVALVIFAVLGQKQSASRLYSRADIFITYILFIGGILLEICAVFTVLMASPWTWLWLEDRRYCRLARISWSLARLLVRRPLWSGKIGQYSYVNYMGIQDESATLSQKVVSLMRKTATAIGVKDVRNKLFWVSKRLDCKYETVDDKLMECVLREIRTIRTDTNNHQQPRQYPHMTPFLQSLQLTIEEEFPFTLCQLHIVTVVLLASTSADDMKSYSADTIEAAQMCRKLSNYMMYLITAHPDSASLLHITSVFNFELTLDMVLRADTTTTSSRKKKDEILRETEDSIKANYPHFPWSMEFREEVIMELAGIWVRLLIYAAGKSRTTELHTAMLARGGELLTFVWLLMAQHSLGDVTYSRIELTPRPDDPAATDFPAVRYVFHRHETGVAEHDVAARHGEVDGRGDVGLDGEVAARVDGVTPELAGDGAAEIVMDVGDATTGAGDDGHLSVS